MTDSVTVTLPRSLVDDLRERRPRIRASPDNVLMRLADAVLASLAPDAPAADASDEEMACPVCNPSGAAVVAYEDVCGHCFCGHVPNVASLVDVVVGTAADAGACPADCDKACSERLSRARSALLTRLATLRERAERAEANYRFMVERAADKSLDGYRELGARVAAAEEQRDSALARAAAAERERDAWVAELEIAKAGHMEAMVARAAAEKRAAEAEAALVEAVAQLGAERAELADAQQRLRLSRPASVEAAVGEWRKAEAVVTRALAVALRAAYAVEDQAGLGDDVRAAVGEARSALTEALRRSRPQPAATGSDTRCRARWGGPNGSRCKKSHEHGGRHSWQRDDDGIADDAWWPAVPGEPVTPAASERAGRDGK